MARKPAKTSKKAAAKAARTAKAAPKPAAKAASKRPARLGKGLSALMAQSVPVQKQASAPATEPAATPATPAPVPAEAASPAEDEGLGLRHVPVDRIGPNPHQPRQRFDAEALQRLADSIAANGLMQPIMVRPNGQGGYELVAGERRWRAAQLAGLEAVPAVVRELDDRQSAELALVENLQREDLNPIERAEAFGRLSEQFGLAHDQIAQQVGVERSTVTNALRLLGLHEDVREMVRDNLLSAGQARALAAVGDPAQQRLLAERAVKEAWSVRRVESAVRAAQQGGQPGQISESPAEAKQRRSARLADLEGQLADQLHTRVNIKPGRRKGSGTLSIEFYSIDEFDRLLSRLGVDVE